jgi:hypothetical protein
MKKQYVLAAAAAGLFAAGSAHALVIDDFATDMGGVRTTLGAYNTQLADASVLGGYREVTINKTAGTGGGSGALYWGSELNPSAHPAAAGDYDFYISQGSASNAVVTLTWDGIGTSGAGGMPAIDITQTGYATGFYVYVLTADQNLNMTFTAKSGSSTSTFTHTFASQTENLQYFVNFSSFTGSADFQSLTSLSLQMSGIAGWDATIAFVHTEPNIPDSGGSVPEPATLGLLGLGLLGLGLSRRKRA